MLTIIVGTSPAIRVQMEQTVHVNLRLNAAVVSVEDLAARWRAFYVCKVENVAPLKLLVIWQWNKTQLLFLILSQIFPAAPARRNDKITVQIYNE